MCESYSVVMIGSPGRAFPPPGIKRTFDLANTKGLLGRCALKHRNIRRESAGWGRWTAKRCNPYSDAPPTRQGCRLLAGGKRSGL